VWDSFTDCDLYTLCFDYGIEAKCVMLGQRLINRDVVERALTEYEHDAAFA
jgi:hypothetical protein